MSPAEEERAAAVRLAALQKMTDAAIARNDSSSATALLRAADSAAKLLATCRANRTNYELNSGRVIPVSEFQELRRAVIVPLAELVQNLPREVCANCNPGDPGLAMAVLEDWQQDRWNRALQAVVEKISQYDQPKEHE
jgi:hypothetical protein